MRYRVDDLPTVAVGAFTPIPAGTQTAANYGLVDVLGSPGTTPIPGPSPDGSLPTVSARSGVNSARPSDVSPDTWFPTLYQASPNNQGPSADLGLGMWRRRFCELPIPAGNPTHLPTAVVLQVNKGSRVTQPWPRPFQRFPTQNG